MGIVRKLLWCTSRWWYNMRDWKSGWPSVTLAHDPTWPDIHDESSWLIRFTQKPALSHKTTCKPLHGWRRLLRHLMCRKCCGATGGSRGGQKRYSPSQPSVDTTTTPLTLPIFFFKHIFFTILVSTALPPNLQAGFDPGSSLKGLKGSTELKNVQNNMFLQKI